MKQSRSHIAYLDDLRVLAAASVVWMHTAAAGLRNGISLSWHFTNLLTSLAFTAVPLFFMISGYLLLSDPRTAEVGQLRRRLPRLLVPLACWTLAAALWNCVAVGNFSPGYLFGQLVGALYQPILLPYWFVYTLLAAYLVSPLLCGGLRATGRGGKLLILALAGLVSLRAMLRPFLPDEWQPWLDLDILNKLCAWGGNLLLFALGYCLGITQRKFDRRLLLGVAAVCYGVIVVGTWQRTEARGSFDDLFLTQSAGFEVLLAACIFLLAKQNLDRPSRFLRKSGLPPLLLPIYFLHAIALRILGHLGVDPLGFPAILAVAALVFVGCAVLSKTLVSIRPLCYALSGIPYEKARKECTWRATFGKGAETEKSQEVEKDKTGRV